MKQVLSMVLLLDGTQNTLSTCEGIFLFFFYKKDTVFDLTKWYTCALFPEQPSDRITMVLSGELYSKGKIKEKKIQILFPKLRIL